MTRYKEGTKRIHINIEVTDAQYRMFKSLGEPKKAFLGLIDAQMPDIWRYDHEIELKQNLIDKTRQEIVVLRKMIEAGKQ